VVPAFARSIDTVLLVAVPVALVGFVMTPFLREGPLRSGPEVVEAAVASMGEPLVSGDSGRQSGR
jgi:hypothetical protein